MCMSACSPCLQTSLHPVRTHPHTAISRPFFTGKSKTLKTLTLTITLTLTLTLILKSKFLIAERDKSILKIFASERFSMFNSLCKREARRADGSSSAAGGKLACRMQIDCFRHSCAQAQMLLHKDVFLVFFLRFSTPPSHCVEL